MADYIFMLETRLSPDQLKAVGLVQELARQHNMNVYLTGGAIRDVVSGFAIRDLDFTVQGNPLRLVKDLEQGGAKLRGSDDERKSLSVLFPGTVRAEIHMARAEVFPKPGQPQISPGTIIEDLRRRDFTVNAMALSLNPGSRGLLLDPSNGIADIEAKLLRILHNYSFLEDPSRLIRATRLQARFHWPLEERTQARYEAARENNYIENISDYSRGYEIEQIAYEDDPVHVMKALEREGWMKALHPHWSSAKVDASGIAALLKTEQQMRELGYVVDAGPVRMYFLTGRFSERECGELQKLIPHKEFVSAWRNLESEAKELAKRLGGKEAATPSRTWELLSNSRPETILFLEVTSRQQGVTQKLRNFLGKWRQTKQRLPFPEMAELRITPDLPVYARLMEDAFRLLLDGKLRSHDEIMKFLKPHEPPPPPPPPPVRRGRAAKPNAVAKPAAGAQGAAAAPAGAKKRRAVNLGAMVERATMQAPAAAEQGKPAAASTKAPSPKAPSATNGAVKKAPAAPVKKQPPAKPKPTAKRPAPKKKGGSKPEKTKGRDKGKKKR
ncbi:MAG: CCA tRNA nucleotidyltransferase [Acidobacteria bacterium]|nr:CCA tRNA nucleotidyltransferase [Acidobacteriota bacterium]